MKSSDTNTQSNKSSENSSISELDLTGSPLKVDLHGDDTCSSFLLDRGSNWTEEEILHFPITLKQARYLICVYLLG